MASIPSHGSPICPIKFARSRFSSSDLRTGMSASNFFSSLPFCHAVCCCYDIVAEGSSFSPALITSYMRKWCRRGISLIRFVTSSLFENMAKNLLRTPSPRHASGIPVRRKHMQCSQTGGRGGGGWRYWRGVNLIRLMTSLSLAFKLYLKDYDAGIWFKSIFKAFPLRDG